MPRFNVGQKVKFRPSHNKSLQLAGTIKAVSETDPNFLTVTAQADGKAVEVERDFETRAEDCTEAD
jgi:ribosome maturation factor RimP